jgi:hypothetical protein
MKRVFSLASMVFLLALAACSAAPTPAAAVKPTATLPKVTDTEPECTAASTAPASQEESSTASLFPPITNQDWSAGSQTARVTFLEYGDFQ